MSQDVLYAEQLKRDLEAKSVEISSLKEQLN